MITTVWKYPLELTDVQTLEVPRGARFLSAGKDPAGQLCVWVFVELISAKITRTVRIVGTGNPTDANRHSFLASVVDGPFVWHVFVDGIE